MMHINKLVRKFVPLTASALLLTGCDQVSSAFEIGMKTLHQNGLFTQPLLVISPGWQMNDHGKAAALFGDSICPGKKGLMVTEVGCIIIDKNTQQIDVKIIDRTANAVLNERWTVERSGAHSDEKILLKRPDNSYVSAWNESKI